MIETLTDMQRFECTGADDLEAVGYAGFEYEFRFDLTGKLIGMGGFEQWKH